jgi:hypothetical protein
MQRVSAKLFQQNYKLFQQNQNDKITKGARTRLQKQNGTWRLEGFSEVFNLVWV